METKPLGAEVLLEAYNLVTNDRQSSYGHPLDDYTKVVEIFNALTGNELSVYEALLFMVSVKLARLNTNLRMGNGIHHDSLVDTLGYLACINMVKEAKNVISR